MSGNGKQMCACQCHPDLSWIRFGDSRIAVSDVDAMFVVERHGHFLYIEWKRLKEPLTQGQRLLLEAQSRQPRTNAVVVYGNNGTPEFLRQFRNGIELEIEETSREDFQRRIDSWYAVANRGSISASNVRTKPRPSAPGHGGNGWAKHPQPTTES